MNKELVDSSPIPMGQAEMHRDAGSPDVDANANWPGFIISEPHQRCRGAVRLS